MFSPRIRTLLAALLAVATITAACGQSEPTETGAPATSVDPEPAATEAEEGAEEQAVEAEPQPAEPEPAQTAEVPSEEPAPADPILQAKGDGTLELGGESFPFIFVDPSFSDEGPDGPSLLAYFGTDDEAGVLAIPVDLAAEAPTGALSVITPDGRFLEAATAEFADTDGDVISATAVLTDTASGAEVVASFELGFGVGNSSFEIAGNQAIVRGDLGSHTFVQVQHLIDEYPEVDTLVLQNIGGSVNDEVNVETGRLVRGAGYTTLVPADGEIYSGGVDLFVSGATRIAEDGAVIGVHSWCCGPNGETADQLSQDDAAHDFQLAYVREMLGPDLGPAWYFFTLQAAPFDGFDPMTPAELDFFNVVTADGVVGETLDVTAEVRGALGEATIESLDTAASTLVRTLGADRLGAPVLTLVGADDTARVATIAEPTDSAAGRIMQFELAANDGAWEVVSATEWAVPADAAPGSTGNTASSLTLEVAVLPAELADLAGVFTKHVDVWGVAIVGTDTTDDADLLHAANVMAQYLDNDADGSPDDPAVLESMVANRATLLMAATPDEFEQLDGDALDQVFDAVGLGGQDLYGSETNRAGRFDASLEEVHHLILNTGWAQVYPEALAIEDGSDLAVALDLARGGHFDRVPDTYPDGAWFTYDDRTCDYDCMLVEYFYWAHTSLLGAQQDRGDEIGHEWRLETAQSVRAGDPTVTALIESLPLPTVLPDGAYTG
ncbi:MAG: hypothetical protein AAF567_23355 [Actinomycetota bacterium]